MIGRPGRAVIRRRGPVVLLSVIALAAAGVSPAAAATTVAWSDVNRNGYTDTWLLDDNFDGRPDRMIIDGNEDGYGESWATLDAYGRVDLAYFDGDRNGVNEQVFRRLYAANGAAYANQMWTDGNGDGRYENQYWDGQADGIYEQVAVDTNFDGWADSWRVSVAPANGGAGYSAAHWAAYQGAVNIYHQAGICVFYCG